MKVLVCGGRDYTDFEVIFDVLNLYAFTASAVIHGGATGADTLAGEWANSHNITCRVYKPDWNKYGNGAGPMRNQKMLDDEKPDLVIAFPGGKGTADMVKRAKVIGTKVLKFDHDGKIVE